MIVPSITRQAFIDIAESIIKGMTPVDLDRCFCFLRKRYGLYENESKVLAIIYTRSDHLATVPNICNYLLIIDSEAKCILENLRDMGYIEEQRSLSWGTTVFRISPAFMEAVSTDRPLSEVKDSTPYDKFVQVITSLLDLKTKPPYPPDDNIWKTDLFDDKNEQKEQKQEPESEADHLAATIALQADRILDNYRDSSFARSVLELVESLDATQRLALYILMAWFVKHFTKSVCPKKFGGKREEALRSSLGALTEEGLIVSDYYSDEGCPTSSNQDYRISPRVAEVFRGKKGIINPAVLSEFGTYTPADSIKEKALFYPERDAVGVQHLRNACRQLEYDRIVEAFRANNLCPRISALLYGPPGTGKTELVRQIARESGRDLLIADASKLNGIYIGEGSVRYRRLFQTYRYICAVSSVCPILMLDEADGILGKRLTEVVRCGDKDANTTQNIILEETNTLPGILLASTNMIENLDKAMLRRFLILVAFHRPDKATRAQLWLAKAPSLSVEEAANLAEHYDISGGEIDNLVARGLILGILENRKSTVDDYLEMCEAQFGSMEKKRIGY